MQLKTITCDVPWCGKSYTESAPGDGWPNWGQLFGIVLNGTNNPCLCPAHLSAVAEFTDTLRGN